MATTGDGGERSGEQRRRQVSPSASGRSKSGPSAESKRAGETTPEGMSQAELPEQFSRYRVKKKLGGGGMGSVYLVENTELKRDEALKVPHFDAGAGEEVRKRFLREAQAAAGLEHANLCQVYHVGVHNGTYFLTMRYLQGKPLSDYTGKPQPPRKVVEITVKLAQALEHAHKKAVIHRDLKPNNIMMCPGVGPVVMDFGLAKQTQEQDQKLTQSGTTLGTPSYMPPEQVKGQLELVGPASDVYSLGVILFEMLTGRRPFEGTTGEIFGKIMYEEPPAPSSLQPGLSPMLDAICRKAMAKAPQDRYPSMQALAGALFEYLRATPPTEGSGALEVTSTGRAEIFQAATVAPSKARAGTTTPRGGNAAVPTTVGAKPPSSIRRPAAPEPVVEASDRPAKSSRGLLIGCGVCLVLFLFLGGIGGGGVLVYLLTQQKSPSTSQVAQATAPAAPVKGAAPIPAVSNPQAPQTTIPSAPKPGPGGPPAETKPPVAPAPGTGSTPVTNPTVPMPTGNNPPKEPVKPMEPEPPDSHVLLREEFKDVDVGGRPKGWEGDSFAVQKEDGKPCLEVTDPKDLHFITLPRMAIRGDFVLDCELRLGGSHPKPVVGGFGPAAQGHEFHLELGSLRGTPLNVLVNHHGAVRLEAGQVKEANGFQPFTNMRFRLTRKGDVYKVAINDQDTVGATIPGKGTFEEVRIGLPGGKVPSLHKGDFLARIYSVRITSLEKDVDKSVSQTPPPGVREEFTKVQLGTLPEGWAPGKGGNIAVQTTGGRNGLELVNPAQGGDFVTLPNVDLKGNFFADFAVVFPEQRLGGIVPGGKGNVPTEPDIGVTVIFTGPATKPLSVSLDVRKTITVAGYPKVEITQQTWHLDKANLLRVERTGTDKAYLVKLNDNLVGKVPLTHASGPFNKVELVLHLKDPQKKSPQVTLVRVVPLEDAAPPK